MTAPLHPPQTCTIVENAQRCVRPGVASYGCETTAGVVQIIRCAEHDPETRARFLVCSGGLVSRRTTKWIDGQPWICAEVIDQIPC